MSARAGLRLIFLSSLLSSPAWAEAPPVTGGALQVLDPERPAGEARPELPLEHTQVEAEVTGPATRVKVVQTFANPYPEPIEAVYVFPLPQDAAVGDMTIKIGERVIKSVIKRRREARTIYEDAKRSGKTAALLEQERANIFTQSVANILPGEKILVEIVYDEVLDQEQGQYELVFPMVVGPRYVPGMPVDRPSSGGGRVADTDRVPDASRITPPALKPGERSGHDVGLRVLFRRGLPVREATSPTHRVKLENTPEGTVVSLAGADTIPNKDFVLRWTLGSDRPQVAVYAHRSANGGHFMLLFEPPAGNAKVAATPKEMYFVVDTSGSMSGEPLALVKRTMRHAIEHLDEKDSFQVIRFSDGVSSLSREPLPASPENKRRGLSFVNGLDAGGGTEMSKGIRAALEAPSPGRLRIVCFMTDGYIGNEQEILDTIRERLGESTRLFSFGVGSSVNRYLLDEMAVVGRGAVQYALLDEAPEAQVKKFYDRLARPLLTHIQVDFGGLEVGELSPSRVPDLFGAQPLVMLGRYKPGRGTMRVRGRIAGTPVEYAIPVDFPATEDDNATLGPLWARAKIADLSRQPGGSSAAEPEITELGLSYRLATPFTSFVAVEDKVVNERGTPVTVQVPVEMPEGVSYESTIGDEEDEDGRGYGETISLAGAAMDVEARAARGRWGVRLGGALGVAGRNEEGAFGVAGTLHLDVLKPIGSRLLVGPAIALVLGNEALVSLLLQTAIYPFDGFGLHLDLGAGGAMNFDAHPGAAFHGSLGYDVLSTSRFSGGLELRYDAAWLPGAERDVHAITMGLRFDWW
jgi:Ca-activated chloride channel homolog